VSLFKAGSCLFTALHRDDADFEKNKSTGWRQGTEIAVDQFVASDRDEVVLRDAC
jgi:hypothetical protein